MDALEAIRRRRSIRAHGDAPVPREVLETLVDAGRLAPSARNAQPWEFVVVSDRGTLAAVARVIEHGKFAAQAGACILVFCADTQRYLEDGCAATENILLAATALGLASCWVAGDKKPYCAEIARIVGAPTSLKLVSLVVVGQPKAGGDASPVPKRSLHEVLHWEGF